MISTDGATLIATLIPIGLLALAFEKRADAVVRSRPAAYFALVRISLVVLVILAALFAIWFCVDAVSQNRAMRGFPAVFVSITSVLFFAVVALEIGTQTIDRYFEALKAELTSDADDK